MADEKKKPEGEEAEGKKKGLPAIVLVALGAAAGGAGTVFMSPKQVEDHGPVEPTPDFQLKEHPDVVKLHFNPMQERGSNLAKVEFHFVYKLDVNREEEVLEAIKTNWNQMFSRVLFRLRRETPNSLRDQDANDLLAHDLISEMSLALFPEGQAVVKDIVWKSFYIQ